MEELRQRPGIVVFEKRQLALRGERIERRISIPVCICEKFIDEFWFYRCLFMPIGRLIPMNVKRPVPIKRFTQFVQALDTIISDSIIPVVRTCQGRIEDFSNVLNIRNSHPAPRGFLITKLPNFSRRVLNVIDAHTTLLRAA